MPLTLTAADRVLVLAPHPDDESIGCAGLLLQAAQAGAARRVVVVTDGDNNPWPQRWIEKRWRIDAAARARWGARRRAEAQAALDVLDVASADRRFLGLPDSALTALLLEPDSALVARLAAELAAFAPTHVSVPSLADVHPDHSALHVALRIAIVRAGLAPRLLVYTVHGSDVPGDDVVVLDSAQRARKRAAIASHATQMRLSGKRFLRFATSEERYFTASHRAGQAQPLRARFDADALQIDVEAGLLRDRAAALRVLAVAWDDQGGATAQVLALSSFAGDTVLQHRVPVGPVAGAACIKLERARRGLVIYDRYGWIDVQRGAVS